MAIFGIDISVWQKDMNLNQAKNEGVKFAIIRGAYGNGKDTAFESNFLVKIFFFFFFFNE